MTQNKPHPLVYLIILTWNDKASVMEAIPSVLETDYPNYKLVVVDNASSDGTQEAIKREYSGRLHLIENTENLRFSGGNNEGIKYALDNGADYVMLLNNDITVDKSMVRLMVEAAERTGAGMAGPMMYYYPPRGEGAELIWYAGGIINYWAGYTAHRGIRKVDRGQYAGVCETDYISGCVLMARSDVVRKVGMLDPAFIYGEDTDWCIRAKKAGYKLIFVPEARMWHKVSVSSGGGLSSYKVYYRIRSSYTLFRRHARPWHWLTIPFFVVLGGLAFMAKSLVTGRPREAWMFMKGIFVPEKNKSRG